MTTKRRPRPGSGARCNNSSCGSVPDGLKCDVKSLCTLAGVPRATLYRTYPHLKAEFDRQRTAAQEAGQYPDPRLAQIERLKAEVATLRERLSRKKAELDTLKDFQATALSRLAAQHYEITTLRLKTAPPTDGTVRRLPVRSTDEAGPGFE